MLNTLAIAITLTFVSSLAHYSNSLTVTGAVCGQSARKQVVRSEEHWRRGYCVSHPAVLSDHTLSGPGSGRWVYVYVPACVYFFSQADNLEGLYLAASRGSFVKPLPCLICTLGYIIDNCLISDFEVSCILHIDLLFIKFS